MKTYDVVIAGGGFAGAYCARTLGRALGHEAGHRRVALIAERNVLVFQPMLAEVVGSALTPTDVVNPLRQFCRHVTVLQGSVQRIDWGAKQLWVDGGRFTRDQPLAFGQLVLALGSVTNLTAVPGLAEYAWPMKNVADAMRLRSALINRLEEANLVEDPAVRARLLTIVVVGGGYTGAETAGQIFDLLRQARRFYPALAAAPIRVVLVHSQAELLPDITPDLGRYAREALQRRGIEVRLNTKVTAVTARRVSFSDGSDLEAHTVITTIGTAPAPLVAALCAELKLAAPKGRVAVEPTLQVPGQAGLWAIGDCAAVPWADRGEIKTAPPTAQFAVRQGEQAGENLARALRGAAPRPFQYTYRGQLAAIGEREAVAEVMGLHFRGFLAWWLWRTIYLSKLPGTLRKLRVMVDWTFDLFFPRDISLLVPPPDEVLRAIHLETGEILVETGSTSRVIYYLRRGTLTLRVPGEPEKALPGGSVIDDTFADGAGKWRGTLLAAEHSDLVVFRGRSYELLSRELKLGPRA
jgi:NADH:quinone reductase (non-electrogenic)